MATNFVGQMQAQSTELGSPGIRWMAEYDKKGKCCAERRQTS